MFPRKLYSTILADPPWQERGGGRVKRGADRHYPLLSVDEICALRVSELAASDAHLYLWATNNFLEEAFRVVRAWRFRFVTCITWGKVSNGRIQTGLGQYFRGASEQLLFCSRGHLPYRKQPAGSANAGKRAQGATLVLEPRGKHSAKPERFRQMIELVSPGPYLELFARSTAPGWDSWGNQVEPAQPIAAVLDSRR